MWSKQKRASAAEVVWPDSDRQGARAYLCAVRCVRQGVYGKVVLVRVYDRVAVSSVLSRNCLPSSAPIWAQRQGVIRSPYTPYNSWTRRGVAEPGAAAAGFLSLKECITSCHTGTPACRAWATEPGAAAAGSHNLTVNNTRYHAGCGAAGPGAAAAAGSFLAHNPPLIHTPPCRV